MSVFVCVCFCFPVISWGWDEHIQTALSALEKVTIGDPGEPELIITQCQTLKTDDMSDSLCPRIHTHRHIRTQTSTHKLNNTFIFQKKKLTAPLLYSPQCIGSACTAQVVCGFDSSALPAEFRTLKCASPKPRRGSSSSSSVIIL